MLSPESISARIFSGVKLTVIFVSLFLLLIPDAAAIPTGTGSEQFPIGSDADDQFNIGGGKVVVQGNSGNVGIGTHAPAGSLDVKGASASRIWTGAGTDTNATGAGELYVEGDLEVDGTIYGDGSGITALPTTLAAGGWVDGGTNVYQTSTSDNVGIGTTSPATTLEIFKQSNLSPLMISSGSDASGDYVLVNSGGRMGIGTWAPGARLTVRGAGTTGGISFQVTDNANNARLTMSDNGRVGIGTTDLSPMLRIKGVGSSTLLHAVTGTGGNALYVQSDGNVGLGTLAPGARLHVQDAGAGGLVDVAVLSVYGNAAAGRGTSLLFRTEQNLAAQTSIDAGRIGVAGESSAPGTTYMSFATGVAGVLSEQMRITSTGNVGMGTTAPVGALAVMNGNVGVGTWSPTAGLEIKGSAAKVWTGSGTNSNATAAGELYVEGDLEVDGTLYGDGGGLTNLSVTTGGGWTDGGTNVFTATTTDNVGIGTTSPASTFEIVKQSTRAPLLVSSSATGVGDYLKVDSSGNVGVGTVLTPSRLSVGNTGLGTEPSLVAAAGGILSLSRASSAGTSLVFTLSAASPFTASLQHRHSAQDNFSYPIALNPLGGNVGIGTKEPLARLSVRGSGSATALLAQMTDANNTPRLNILDNGNTGIGSVSPAARLVVTGTGGGTANALQVDNSSNAHILTVLDNGQIQSQAGTTISDTSVTNLLIANTGNSNAFKALRITTNSGATEALTVTNAGNVGIGTATPVGALTVMNGNVGIGTWSPNNGLEIKGRNAAVLSTGGTNTNATGAGELYVEGDLEVDGTIYGDGSGITSLPTTLAAGGWVDGGTNVFQSATSDNVGIGTTSPMGKLVVVGGNVGLGTTTPVGGLAVMSGNVGIGTWSPTAALEVNGAIQMTGSGDSYYNGNLGVGVTSPTQALDVNGTVKMTGFLLPTGAVSGRVLTSDASGNGTWAAISGTVSGLNAGYLSKASSATAINDSLIYQSGNNIGIGTSTPVGGVTFMNGNVGIGTWKPLNKLTIGQNIGALSGYTFSASGTDGTMFVQATSPTNWSGVNMYDDTSVLSASFQYGNPSAAAFGDQFVIASRKVTTPVIFYQGGSGAANERVRLDTGGNVILKANVGIGTDMTSASARLAVLGGNVGLGTTTPVGGLAVMNGNVGVGTWSPSSGLEVKGVNAAVISTGGTNTNATGAGELYVQGDLEVDGTIYGDGSGITSLATTLPAGGWTDVGTSIYTSTTSDKVGIGTTTPISHLSLGSARNLVGDPSTQIAVAENTAPVVGGPGNYFYGIGMAGLSGGGEGLGLWGGSEGNLPNAGNAHLFILRNTGNIGIGTFAPKSLFEVSSTVASDLFRINDNGGGDSTPFIIDSNGNVGISTTVPGARLDIAEQAGLALRLRAGNTTSQFSKDQIALSYNGGTLYSHAIRTRHNSGGLIGNSIDFFLWDPALDATTATGTRHVMSLANGNVGIGTQYPNNGKLIVWSGNVGIGTSIPINGTAIMNGNVGIGTWSPSSGLEVKGLNASVISTGGTNTNATGAGELYVQGDLEVDGTIYGDGSGITSLPTTLAAGGWVDGGTNVYQSATSDNVGIGTTTPSARFEIVGGAVNPFMVSSVPTAGGDYLLIGSAGAVGIGTTDVDGVGVGMVVMNGYVGIGTIAPRSHLSVAGNGASMALIGDPTYGGYVGISLNGSLAAGRYNFLSGSSDTNLFINRPSGGEISFRMNNLSTHMLINSLGNVGIGTTLARNKLAVNGGVGIGTTATSNFLDMTAPAGGLIVQNSVGIGTTTPVAGLSVMNGNVGIGTWSPSSGLEVKGLNASVISTGGTNTNATGAGELYVQGDLEVDGTIYGDGSGITSLPATLAAGGWVDGGTNVFQSATSDNVGIGTTSPMGKLVVVGGNVGIGTSTPGVSLAVMGNIGVGTWTSTNGSLEIQTHIGTEIYFPGASSTNISAANDIYLLPGSGKGLHLGAGGVNDYLVVASGGNIGVGTTAPSGGVVVMNGNVGIGTWSPDQMLQVKGSVKLGGNGTIGNAILSPVTAGGLLIKPEFNISDTGPGVLEVRSNDNHPLIVVQESGNVGIGTYTASGKLVVENDSLTGAIDQVILIGRSNAAPDRGIGILFQPPGPADTYLNGARILAANEDNVGSSYLAVSTGITGTLTERLRITSRGNVGIGTTTPVSGTSIMNGNVGIGTWSPNNRLEVVGTVAATAFSGDGSGLTGISAGGWMDGGTNVFQSTTSDNVGIGTTSPNAATLEIVKNAAQPVLKVSSSATGGGDFLVVDSSGNIGVGTNITGNSALSVITGNVGIGTWKPHQLLVVGVNPNNQFTVNSTGSINTNSAYIGGSNVNAGGLTVLPAAIVGFTPANWFDTPDARFYRIGTGTIGIGTTSNNGAGVLYSRAVGIGTFNVTQGNLIVNLGNVGLGTTTPVNGTAILNGNVGIGTWSPGSQLEVKGGNASVISTGGTNTNATGAGELYVQGDLEVDGTIYGDGSGITSLSSSLPAGGWTDGGAIVSLTADTDRVGIGTTLNGTGVALTVMNGNVGIGTWVAGNSMLMVAGDINFATGNLLRTGDLAFRNSGGVRSGNSGGRIGIGGTSSSGEWIVEASNAASSALALYPNTNNADDLGKAGNMVRSGFFGTSVGIGTWQANSALVIAAGNAGIGTLNPVGALTVMSGNVGIGTWSPNSQLEVKGGNASVISTGATNTNATGAGELYVQGDLEVDGTIYGDGSGITSLPTTLTAGGWVDGGTNVFQSSTTDNIGIGTTSPNAATLEIVKNAAQSPLKISSTATGAGDFLNVSSAGRVGIGTALNSSGTGLSVMNGNVGIGTWNPTYLLDVKGTFRTSGSALFYGSTFVTSSKLVLYDNIDLGFGGSGGTQDVSMGWNSADDSLRLALGTDATSNASNWLTIKGGNMGLGTINPLVKLAVGSGNPGQAGANGVFIKNDLEVDGTIYLADGTALTNASDLGAATGWTDGGTNVFQAATSDNVGIGTTSPNAATLEIVKNAAQAPLKISATASGSGDLFVVTSEGNVGIGTSLTSGALSIMNGNVGIGTFKPQYKLEIRSDDSLVQAKFQTNGAGYAPASLLLVAQQNAQRGQGIYMYNTGASEHWYAGVPYNTNSDRYMIAYKNAAAFDGTAAQMANALMTVTKSGNVGIGTTTPVAGLSVMSGNVGIGTWNPGMPLEMVGHFGGNVALFDSRASVAQISARYTGGYGFVGAGSNGATNIAYYGTRSGVSTANLVVTSSGNVGIGTITPAGGWTVMNGNVGVGTWSPTAALEVVGTVKAAAFVGDGSGLTNVSAGGWTDTGATVNLTTDTDSVGIGTTLTAAGTGLSVMNGNVGIGTWSARNALVVAGSATVNTNLTVGGTLTFQGTKANTSWGSSPNRFRIKSTTAAEGFALGTSNNQDLIMMTDAGFVGIGTLYPSSTLTVNGGVGIGTRTSDSYINTNAAPPGGLIVQGNVGIGTWNPTSGLQLNSSFAVYRTSSAASVSTAGQTLIGVTDTSAPRTITLATADMAAGRVVMIKDESGGAGTNNITIDTEGAEKIDGQDSITITVDYGVLRVYSDGSNWFAF